MKLIESYQHILSYVGLKADERGFVSLANGVDPIFLNGNRLVLPTQYQLRECVDNERIIMHPYIENFVAGESSIVKKLKLNINVRINAAITSIAPALLELVQDQTKHALLNPEQQRLLTSIKSTDGNTAMNFSTLAVGLMKEAADRAFANVYLVRGGEIKKKKYGRAGIVTFPFYRDLKDGKIKPKRSKDTEAFMQIMEFMFPEINEPEAYDVGSDSRFAPWLQALLLSSANITSRINDLVELYRPYLRLDQGTTEDRLTFDLKWLNDVTNLDDYSKEINSVMAQKDGAATIERSEPQQQAVHIPVVQAQQPQMQPMQQQAVYQQPAPVAPTPTKTKDGLDFKSMFPSQPQFPQQPMMMPGMVPGMMMAPGYPQQPMMPQGMMPMPQQRVPSWAQIPPEQQMVMTPNGPMTQAAAISFNIPYQMVQQQPQPQMQQMYPGQGFPQMQSAPGWSR